MPRPSGRNARTIDRGLVDIALSGLSRPQKTLPAKLFYDEEGCRLFYRITELPEYYLTRTERSLLPEVARQTVELLPSDSVLVEYGASDEGKAAFLLDPELGSATPRNPVRAYVPIDVATSALTRMCERLAVSHPQVAVHPVVADFLDPVVLPARVDGMCRIGFFPGSTIGNLDPLEATHFLRLTRKTLGPNSYFLVGVDLRKEPAMLVPAYDDAAGVTAAFNRNMLVRLNREAGANFDPNAFAHCAVWNDSESRIEMHLVSQRTQTVRIAGTEVSFAARETIHTENSYKYAPERFRAIVQNAGWQTRLEWQDPAALFALFLLESVTSS